MKDKILDSLLNLFYVCLLLFIVLIFFYTIKVKNNRYIKILTKDNTLNVNSSLVLEVDNHTTDQLIYETDDSKIATVDASGKVVAIKPGKVKIKVKNQNGRIKDTLLLTIVNNNKQLEIVNVETESVQIVGKTNQLYVGNTYDFEAIITPNGSSNVIWTSSNENIITVDNNGTVKAIGKGVAKIYARTKNDKVAEYEVLVLEEEKDSTDKQNKPNTNKPNTNKPNTNKPSTNKPNKKIEVTGINLNKTSLTINENEKYKLYATVEPKNATNKNITWTTNNSSIINVTNDGTITGLKEGEATVVAKTNNGKVASATIKVIKKKIPVNKIESSNTNLTIVEQEERYLKADVKPSNATNPNLKWTSSNNDVATVDSNGLVHGIKKGTTTINCTSISNPNITIKFKITVIEENKKINVTSVKLNKTKTEIYVGNKEKIKADVKPSNATNKEVIWISSNPKVATVDSNGNIYGKSIGTTDITVKTIDNEKTDSITVVIKGINAKQIKLNKTKTEMYVGSKEQIKATISPSNTTDKNIIWTSSNPKVATISNGLITANKAGTTTITAKTHNGKVASLQVNVRNINATSISLNKTKTEIYVGSKEQITATVNPSNASIKTVSWTSSNNNIVTVSDGLIIGKNVGTATITAKTHNGKTANLQVIVKKVPVSGISLNKTNITLAVGSSTQVTANVTPNNATDKSVRWTSSNNSVATVSNGLIKANKLGTATITATTNDGNKTSKITVTTYNKVNRIHFMDTQVGKYAYSDSIILESDGKYAMVDAGLNYSNVCERLNNYLDSIGGKTLEFILITHWHNDHFGCLDYIASKKQVKAIYLKKFVGYYSGAFSPNEYNNTINKYSSKIKFVKSDIKLYLGNYSLQLYNTQDRLKILKDKGLCNKYGNCNENYNSIVIKGKINNKTFYLAGDMQGYKAGNVHYKWEEEIAKKVGNVDLYKVAHHGHGISSQTYNNSEETINYLKPKYSVMTTSHKRSAVTGIDKTHDMLARTSGNNIYYSGCGNVVATFKGNKINITQSKDYDNEC